MDLSKLEIPDTVSIHIEFPGIGKLYADEAKKKPVTIELLSPASDEAVEFNRKIQRKALANASKGRKHSITTEEIEEQSIDRLVAFTASVKNLVYKGEEIKLKDVRKVYDDPKMGWLCDQVAERLGSWDDFLG